MEGLDEYKQVVYDRYTNLNEDERGLIDTLADSPVGEVLTKLFGPEMGDVFAEDTNIFAKNQFTSNVSSHSQPDGSDLNSYLENLFKILDTPEANRKNLPHHLKMFPYVNGELFSKDEQLAVLKNIMLTSDAKNAGHKRHDDWLDRFNKITDLVESANRKADLQVSQTASAIASRDHGSSSIMALAECSRRSRCSLSLNTHFLYKRIPSKIPSP